jgi:hypothetical protein
VINSAIIWVERCSKCGENALVEHLNLDCQTLKFTCDFCAGVLPQSLGQVDNQADDLPV